MKTKNKESSRYITEQELRDAAKRFKFQIIQFFLDNPNPSDEQVHQFALENSVTPAFLEKLIYEMFTDFLGCFKDESENVEYSEKCNLQQHSQDNVDLFIDSLYDNLKNIDPNLVYEVRHGNPTVINFSSQVPGLNMYYHKVLDKSGAFSGIKSEFISVTRRGNKYVVSVNYIH